MEIKEVSLADVITVHERIPEFVEHFPYTLDTFRERTENRKTVCLMGYVDGNAAGYIVGYEKDGDGSFYCWMAGVDPAYRRNGVLSAMMDYLCDWAKKEGYMVLRIKTRNNRREMLSFLVKRGFHFLEVEKHDRKEDHRILLEKELHIL